jgi:hypothetical protein
VFNIQFLRRHRDAARTIIGRGLKKLSLQEKCLKKLSAVWSTRKNKRFNIGVVNVEFLREYKDAARTNTGRDLKKLFLQEKCLTKLSAV